MNTKTLILVCEYEHVLKEIDKIALVELFEATQQKGQMRYELTSKYGFKYDVCVFTLDGFIDDVNFGACTLNTSSDFISKIVYSVEVKKTFSIQD